jgi:hypothetical protein
MSGEPAEGRVRLRYFCASPDQRYCPAAECLTLARSGTIRLVWSDYVVTAIRELPLKLPARLLVTQERDEAFLRDVAPLAETIDHVRDVYQHPLDVDNSHYVNLALAANAQLITSRDRHLLA